MNLHEKAAHLKKNPEEYAQFKTALQILGDRWSALVLLCLFEKPQRFIDIQQKTGGINPRTLSQRLHMMEAEGLIEKHEFKEFPPRTEYQLTQKAHELKAAISELKKWAHKYCRQARDH